MELKCKSLMNNVLPSLKKWRREGIKPDEVEKQFEKTRLLRKRGV